MNTNFTNLYLFNRQSEESALAINSHILKRATSQDYQVIKDLSDELYKISRNHSNLDMLLMAEVIWPSKEDWKGKKIGDVEVQTWLLAKDFSTFVNLLEEKQKELLGVCYRLSFSSGYYSHHLGLGHFFRETRRETRKHQQEIMMALLGISEN